MLIQGDDYLFYKNPIIGKKEYYLRCDAGSIYLYRKNEKNNVLKYKGYVWGKAEGDSFEDRSAFPPSFKSLVYCQRTYCRIVDHFPVEYLISCEGKFDQDVVLDINNPEIYAKSNIFSLRFTEKEISEILENRNKKSLVISKDDAIFLFVYNIRRIKRQLSLQRELIGYKEGYIRLFIDHEERPISLKRYKKP